MNPSIAVCGSDFDDEHLNEEILGMVEEVGREIARAGAILICGGRGGVMESACKGAKEENGITVGILPVSKEEANPYVDIPIPTGLGNLRDFLVVNSADAVIAICGRWGTLNEISFAMILKKPLILMNGSDGVVQEIINNNILNGDYQIANSAKEAVEKAIQLIKGQ